MEMIIAVNELDEVTGYLEKMDAHRKGLLHRAISVFIMNQHGEWLLQQRASEKYHSRMLWSNACCTHTMKGETNIEAANRRLKEEMGLEAKLKYLFPFQYKAHLDNDLIENELDHIFVGYTDESPVINKHEVASFRYINRDDLAIEITNHPERFTEWFKLLFDRVDKSTAS